MDGWNVCNELSLKLEMALLLLLLFGYNTFMICIYLKYESLFYFCRAFFVCQGNHVNTVGYKQSVSVCMNVLGIDCWRVCVLNRSNLCLFACLQHAEFCTCQTEGFRCYKITARPCSFSLWSSKWDWTWGTGNWGALICPLQRLPELVK